ncbi:hypothetical protein NLG97_g7180 [Lecanicillium saksenae]|uniref:Uncharacterized protein n=1 Tax=Lecanicillium saksenae TaxID=468837 RepID=A0ACC1QPV6_9HYPO|nr:hypothetical protein NLG97_g7180 [Lecanicillium saksenae]
MDDRASRQSFIYARSHSEGVGLGGSVRVLFITKHSKTKFNPGPASTVFIMGSLAHNMSLGEIDVNSPNLRLHLQGFITLLMVSGGVQKVLERKDANILAIIYVIVSCTTMNTTSPSTDMINGEFSFTNQDIYTCYASTLHPSFPCPTQLFLCIRDVNRLRRQIASGDYSAGLMQAAIHAVFENIAAFRPDQWLERYEMPRASFRATLARIYQVAVALYAKLTLASHASIEYKADDQVAEARHLIHLIVSAKDSMPPKPMCWPLIVAGAALAPARYSDKAAVEERLHEVGSRSDAGDGALAALTCLRAFWVSGKTSWDDCFTKPIFPLAE